MAYDKKFYEDWLRKDRDDMKRSQAFDEAYPLFTEPEKALCDLLLCAFSKAGLGENAAKACVAELIVFGNMRADEQDRRLARAERIRAEYEWAYAGKLHEDVSA